MGNMDGWDVALLAMAGYVAVMSLVHLMIRRRDQLIEQFRHEVEREKKARKEADKMSRRQRAA